MIYSKLFRDYVTHLTSIFSLCREKRIHFKPSKTYLNYPNVQFLGKYVDSLGLITAAKKIETIQKFKFPKTLAALKRYLGVTGWIREYVQDYAIKVRPLQDRKTKLLAAGPRKGRKRMHYSLLTAVNDLTEKEIEAFRVIQKDFKDPIWLSYHDPEHQLYMGIDSSGKRGIKIVIYYFKNPKPGQDEHEMITYRFQPIMFLSKRFTAAEKNYRATELEIAGLVWTIRRVRHLIEICQKLPVIVYTDHAAIISIMAKGKLHSSNVDRLNIRFTRVSQYLSQFEFDMRYKPGREHILPDAISRLISTAISKDDREEILNFLACAENCGKDVSVFLNGQDAISDRINLYGSAYHVTLVKMAEEKKKLVVQRYQDNPAWKTVWDMLHKNDEITKKYNLNPGNNGLQFMLQNELIYYTRDGENRLCLPKYFEKKVFKLAHDDQAHPGLARSVAKIRESIYMNKLTHRIRKYIQHCSSCGTCQT